MAIFRNTVSQGNTGVNLRYAPKKSSTVLTPNTLLTVEAGTGFLIPAVPASTYVKGLAVERVASTDPDFAATTEIGYDEPREGEVFIMDVDNTATGGFVPGVSRALINAGLIKAAVPGADIPLVRIHKILPGNQAVVSLITMTNNS